MTRTMGMGMAASRKGREKNASNGPECTNQETPPPPSRPSPPSPTSTSTSTPLSLPQKNKRRRIINQTAAIIRKQTFDYSNHFERRRLLKALEDAVPVVHHAITIPPPSTSSLQDNLSYFLPHTDSNSIGIGKFELTNDEHVSMNELSDLIVNNIRSDGATWGDDDMNSENDEEEEEDKDMKTDPRRRMYGFLNRQALIDSGIKISTLDDDCRNQKEHSNVLHSASVDLKLIPTPSRNEGLGRDEDKKDGRSTTSEIITINACNMPLIVSSLQSITEKVHKLVPPKYKKYVSIEQLIAVQPNLHNGASYLPLHLDLPRLDGFGVVIVTLAIHGNGTIVLVDDGDDDDDSGSNNSNNDRNKDQHLDVSSTSSSKSYSFDVKEGYSYVLCGDARNKCMHGVLVTDTPSNCARETLNLRYGLHTEEFAYEEIDQHWK
mmetsp:Transcript_15325/g.37919  ORF Transcript_15325/g.37919 Transcript_15325/m.37919 type:complete len:434 (+) Transcript_15325:2934-4235(+)